MTWYKTRINKGLKSFLDEVSSKAIVVSLFTFIKLPKTSVVACILAMLSTVSPDIVMSLTG